jgi:6-phosphogluconolactonase
VLVPPPLQQCPTWLQVHPSGKWLVACHELSAHVGAKEGEGFVSSYKIGEDGGLTLVCTTPTSGRGNTCVGFDRNGRFVLTTRYWEGGVAVLPFNAVDGTISPVSCAPLHKGIGPHPLRQSMPHPHGILGDPKTDLVYAMDLGTDCVHQCVTLYPIPAQLPPPPHKHTHTDKLTQKSTTCRGCDVHV